MQPRRSEPLGAREAEGFRSLSGGRGLGPLEAYDKTGEPTVILLVGRPESNLHITLVGALFPLTVSEKRAKAHNLVLWR